MFIQLRSFATKVASSGAKKRPVQGITDKRMQVVRDILYPAPLSQPVPPALKVSAETLSQREIIERMWCHLKVSLSRPPAYPNPRLKPRQKKLSKLKSDWPANTSASD
ncbi:hypothetical protein HDU99_002108 [Rhizoclosmatium hyalinum]|nr:hypothetical protein HDU99_002108 [Rhizoclosmatium hyalinum]